jgi:osmoprotectant transport system ATP-binding protein
VSLHFAADTAFRSRWDRHVIVFDGVTKRFPDGTVAVAELDLEVTEGEVVVLVGPSGCGKTTSLRMINRMIEPSGGQLLVDGRNALEVPAHELRRGIGYVIQQAGLFPHRTIAENIGTVPSLVGWEQDRTDTRVEELMELVGLPTETAARYPHQLSGGQQQRVGVARALAVDPPILLMDEPFGAVDPIVRSRLQEELLSLQAQVHKTIVFVTHDIDEAISVGDRIAILNVGGQLEQFDTPARLLAEPANDFVADFLGEERALKLLALRRVSQVTAAPGPVVGPDSDTADAVRIAAEHDTNWVIVVDHDRQVLGWQHIAELNGHARLGDGRLRKLRLPVQATDTLRAALNSMVVSGVGMAVRIGPTGTYEGVLTQDLLSAELSQEFAS